MCEGERSCSLVASAGKIIDNALDAGVEACLYAVVSKPTGNRLIRAEESNNNIRDLPDLADPRELPTSLRGQPRVRTSRTLAEPSDFNRLTVEFWLGFKTYCFVRSFS